MAEFADGRIEAYLGPPELGAADDLETVIVDFISGARARLDIAVQELDNAAIAQAILDASWRGVRGRALPRAGLPAHACCRAIRRRSRFREPGRRPSRRLRRLQWLEDDTELAENRRILAALLRSDIQVRGDYNPKIFHQKFILRDYRRQGHPDLGVADRVGELHGHRHPPQPQPCLRLPQRLRLPPVRDRGRAAAPGIFGRGLHGDVPKVYDLAGVPVKVLFAPDHTPELEIMKQMLKGTREIYFAIFTFAGSSGIDDAMLALARGGVKIKGVLDPAQAKQDWAAPMWLVHPNIELYVPKRDGRLRQPAQAPPQADGDRRADRRRRQLQLHRSPPTSTTTRTSSSSAPSTARSKGSTVEVTHAATSRST